MYEWFKWGEFGKLHANFRPLTSVLKSRHHLEISSHDYNYILILVTSLINRAAEFNFVLHLVICGRIFLTQYLRVQI